MAKKITSSSTAEYFSKNLQQVGFSSMTKAVLTTLKEAVDNSLDACDEESILPEISVLVQKKGAGSLKNSDLIRIVIDDNGPGIDADDLSKVYGEYLASSKFGRGRCTRGQQGIGISAAVTWAQMTNARGVRVITKTKNMRLAVTAIVEVDFKNNKGIIKEKESVKWDRPHGVSVEFMFDGRVQLGGEGGVLTYLNGTALVNPHLSLKHKLLDNGWVKIERVSQTPSEIPEAAEPHPHTMKLGEFIAHSHLFGKMKLGEWLKKGFSRVHDGTLKELVAAGFKKKFLTLNVESTDESVFKDLYGRIQKLPLMAPSTKSVLTIGEEALSKSVLRMGEVDFFSVVTRKPTICDFKPVSVAVAIARLKNSTQEITESAATVLRFANRVPLQFDKSSCAIVKALESVNWRTYGLAQPKDSLPLGPYVFAISLVSPFIKFKNASKETVDASDELVDELRLALIQAGQRVSRHIKAEDRAHDLEQKRQHIEQFGPILVEGLVRITNANEKRKLRAEEGLRKLLGRDSRDAENKLQEAVSSKKLMLDKQKAKGFSFNPDDSGEAESVAPENGEVAGEVDVEVEATAGKKKGKSKTEVPSKKTKKSEKKSAKNIEAKG